MNANVIKYTKVMRVMLVHQPIKSDTINKYIEYRNDCQREVAEVWCCINIFMLTMLRSKVKFGPPIFVVYILITTLSSIIMTSYICLKNRLFLNPCCSENKNKVNRFGFCQQLLPAPLAVMFDRKSPRVAGLHDGLVVSE